MPKKEGKVEAELAEVRDVEEKILDRLEKDEKIERKILKKVEKKKTHENKVKKFDFADFGQIVVGAIVFGVPTLFTPDFWVFLNNIPTYKVLMLHLFFLLCVVITINYAFRKSFSFNKKFLKQLSKRLFYIYITVMLTIVILLWGFQKISPDMLTLDFLRYVIATHSVGMVGAVTFDFIAD